MVCVGYLVNEIDEINGENIYKSDSPSSSEMLISLGGFPVFGLSSSSSSSSKSKSTIISYTLTNLIPSSFYNVYCVTISPSSVVMSTKDMLNSKMTISTKCCRELVVRLNKVSFDDESDVPFALTIDIGEGTLLNEIMVKISIIEVNSSKIIENIFVPSEITFSPSSSLSSLNSISNSIDLNYIGKSKYLEKGKYNLKININTTTTNNNYIISFPSGKEFIVRGKKEELPSPLMIGAIFSSDGSKITISFDSPTNEGGGYLKYKSDCSNFFQISHLSSISLSSLSLSNSSSSSLINSNISKSILSSSKCVWKDEKSLEMSYVGISSKSKLNSKLKFEGLNIGDEIQLKSKVLKAQCFSNIEEDCVSWSYSPSHSITISTVGSSSLLVPVVEISMSNELGVCDDLKFDLSSSKYSGGRSWKFLSIKNIKIKYY